MAGISSRTMTRIESGADYKDPRSLAAVQAALGIGEHADDADPPLSKATAIELAGELVRRLSEAEKIIEHDRVRRAAAPDDLDTRPNQLNPPDGPAGQSGTSDG